MHLTGLVLKRMVNQGLVEALEWGVNDAPECGLLLHQLWDSRLGWRYLKHQSVV